VIAGSTACAEGILGNFIGGSFGYPTYSELTYDSGSVVTIEGNYFVTPNVYGIAGYAKETIKDGDSTGEATLSAGGLKFGAGFEQVLQNTQAEKVSLFGEIAYSNMKSEVELDLVGSQPQVTSVEGNAITFTGGARSQINKLVSEVAMNYVTYNSDEIETENDLNLSSLVGVRIAPQVVVGVNALIDLDWDYSVIGVTGAVQF
jgi:hypothetical protein